MGTGGTNIASGTSLSFSITNALTPPSLTPLTGFALSTASSSGGTID
jgi:hypothetical protein